MVFFYKTIEILSFRRSATLTASIYYMHMVANIFYLFIYIYIYIHTRVDGSCNAQLFMNQCNLPVFFS